MKNKLTYIIDDDKLTVKLMSILISKSKFCEEIHSFNNAQFAIDKLKENWDDSEILPDAILLDLNMPVMDGWQFLDEFIHLPIKKEISIFIMTSSIDPADIEMAKKYDVIKDYIMKPITANKLDMLCKLISKIN
ncbi:MAG: response regulator [Flavobacterium sp.]|jgi:CheY-like chemotaxis protein|uniref:response regulator n=1 Tax=unclassified Flavobacterium TaxID=196869 RepID=UPI000C1A7117|nr:MULTISPECIES: response regulator [unclassified Flavobacterium]MDI6050984.1 response regulator [Flavobacterium sp. XS2P24]MDP3680558.1 response regulator [Flavobacterium sp.]MDZ4328969.1 response regulator [Flavobacterium sp.]PIF63409.1 response regulator receiver domain-containing protein [Flavobacterium sp. 11]RKS13745.1 response regulator receiver domain-containing protein [Flavobacterium sp. 120]